MSIPAKPLEVKNFDPAKMSLGALILFRSPETLTGDEQVVQFVKFCEAHTNWTKVELLDITGEEVADVSRQLAEALARVAVPKVSAPPSKPGRGRKPIPSPAG
jgi:hypothetical protein